MEANYESIYINHLQELRAGNINVAPSPEERKFHSIDEVRAAITSGEIIPAIVREAIYRSQTIYGQIGVYSLLEFSSKKWELEFKKVFTKALEQLFNS